MRALAFTVPGEVRGWARARLGRSRTGAPIHFTDKKTASFENLVAYSAHQAMRGQAPISEPVRLSLTARIVPAASASAKARARMLAGAEPPAKKPDLDNVLKAVLDGCNGVAFVDDKQVVEFERVRKVYAETAGVDVVITAVAS